MDDSHRNEIPIPTPTATKPEDEKRRDLRIPLRVLKVNTQIQGQVFFGYAKNVSTSGLFIETPNPRPTGTRVPLVFELPKTQKVINCLAEIVWTRDYSGRRAATPGMGLRYLEISEDSLRCLREFIDEQNL